MSVAQDDQLANGTTRHPELRSAVAGSGMDGEGRCAAGADNSNAPLSAWKPEASAGKPEKRGRGRPQSMAQHHLDDSSRALSALNLLSQPVKAFTPVVTESGRKAVSVVKTRPRQSADANAFLKTRPGLHDILKSRKNNKQSASLRSLRFLMRVIHHLRAVIAELLLAGTRPLAENLEVPRLAVIQTALSGSYSLLAPSPTRC
jgi:hypothetical protein